MIYSIIRTSNWMDETPPIDKAFIANHECWQTRTCTEEYFNKHFSYREGLWKSKGTNHKEVEGGKWISRQEEDVEKWSIEINTLEELMAIVKEHGDIIIKQNGMNTVTPEIEIYDGYRE